MAKIKTLKQWQSESQNRADTYNKTTYLLRDGNHYQISFKVPKPENISEAMQVVKIFTPKEI